MLKDSHRVSLWSLCVCVCGDIIKWSLNSNFIKSKLMIASWIGLVCIRCHLFTCSVFFSVFSSFALFICTQKCKTPKCTLHHHHHHHRFIQIYTTCHPLRCINTMCTHRSFVLKSNFCFIYDTLLRSTHPHASY